MIDDLRITVVLKPRERDMLLRALRLARGADPHFRHHGVDHERVLLCVKIREAPVRRWPAGRWWGHLGRKECHYE